MAEAWVPADIEHVDSHPAQYSHEGNVISDLTFSPELKNTDVKELIEITSDGTKWVHSKEKEEAAARKAAQSKN